MNQFLSFKGYRDRGKKWLPSRKKKKKSSNIELHSGSPSNRPMSGSNILSASNSIIPLHWLCTALSVYGTKFIISLHDIIYLRHLLKVPSSIINVSNSKMKFHLREVGLEIQWLITGTLLGSFLGGSPMSPRFQPIMKAGNSITWYTRKGRGMEQF